MAAKDSVQFVLESNIVKPLENNGVEFVRDVEVECREVELRIHQYSVGDVGCVVWDAGIVLAKYLDQVNSCIYPIAGKSVIDVGSGTGIVGLFAATLGADVILTDLPEVIPLLDKNIKSNQTVLSGTVSASVLTWGEDAKKFSPPDILLVSDCIYYDMSVKKLIPTLNTLTSEKTNVFISYEDRDLGNKKELLRKFLVELKKTFDVTIIPASEQHKDFQSCDIHLLKCKKKVHHQGG